MEGKDRTSWSNLAISWLHPSVMLCCCVVLTMTTALVAPSSFRIILDEGKQGTDERRRAERCRRDARRMIGGSMRNDN